VNDALSFIIALFGELLISLANIPFVLGYILFQFLVACSFMVLVWQLAMYILSRSSGSVRSGVKHGIRNSQKPKREVTERWTK